MSDLPPVLILCGGQGTRIRGVGPEDVPKPMIRVGARPILWHVMKGYAAHGCDRFVLLLGHQGEAIKRFFLDYRAMTSDLVIRTGRGGGVEYLDPVDAEDWRVTLTDTGAEAMTGARIFRGLRHVPGDTFFATYGDGVADVDVSALLAFHRAHGRLATVTGVRPPGRFGELTVEGDRVTSFTEKPPGGEGLINGGFFVFQRGFVERYLRDDDVLVLEREPLARAAADGELRMYRHPGFWQPMDTFRDYVALNDLWKGGAPPWKVWP